MGVWMCFISCITAVLIRSRIHRLANQEVLRWQLAMQNEIGNDVSHEDIKQYLWKTLKAGQVVPGHVLFQSLLCSFGQ